MSSAVLKSRFFYFSAMREKLRSELGERKRFSALVSKFGKKTNFKGYSEETILLTKVTNIETGELMTDHLWINFTAAFEQARIAIGDRIAFDARVKAYQKGYVNKQLGLTSRQTDFKLSHLTKIIKV